MKTIQDMINEKTEKAQKWIKEQEILGHLRIKHYAGFPGVHVERSFMKDGEIFWMMIKYVD